jgi:alkylated DNA repair dioxygenase AlkB
MQVLIKEDGLLRLQREFLAQPRALAVFEELLESVAWQEEEYTIYGRAVKAPRLMHWYGDPEASYTYSGVLHKPSPWLPLLTDLKTRIEAACECEFNSVLVNRYRNGSDSMGWHSDAEAELGPDPCIASLSLGTERLFKIRHKKTKVVHDIVLPSGSLLIMSDSFQAHWQHSVPKTRRSIGERINLTFRLVKQL